VSITVNGITFHGFEEFRYGLLWEWAPQEKIMERLTREIKQYEERFGMGSEEMAQRFERG